MSEHDPYSSDEPVAPDPLTCQIQLESFFETLRCKEENEQQRFVIQRPDRTIVGVRNLTETFFAIYRSNVISIDPDYKMGEYIEFVNLFVIKYDTQGLFDCSEIELAGQQNYEGRRDNSVHNALFLLLESHSQRLLETAKRASGNESDSNIKLLHYLVF